MSLQAIKRLQNQLQNRKVKFIAIVIRFVGVIPLIMTAVVATMFAPAIMFVPAMHITAARHTADATQWSTAHAMRFVPVTHIAPVTRNITGTLIKRLIHYMEYEDKTMKSNKRRDFLKLSVSTAAGAILTIGGANNASALSKLPAKDQVTSFSPYPVKAEGIFERHKRGLLLITREETTVELNSLGSFIWQHIDGSKSLHHLAQLVTDTYGVSFNQSLQDTHLFIEDLEKETFIRLPRSGPCFPFPV